MPTGQNPAMGGSIVKGEHDAPRGCDKRPFASVAA